MGYHEEKYPISINVRVVWSDGQVHTDSIKGLNAGHALYRAWDNWEDAESITIGGSDMTRREWIKYTMLRSGCLRQPSWG